MFFSSTSACSCLAFQHCKYGSKTILLSAHNLSKDWILKEDNRFDEEIQKHKTDK